MVLVEGRQHLPAVRDFDEGAVIGSHARSRDDIQLRTDGKENVSFENSFDYYNPGVARKIGEIKLEMERAARTGSVRQVRRREPEVSQPILRNERQSHLAGL